MNITKELEQKRTARLDDASSLVNETKMLLSAESAEEIRALKALGLSEHIRITEEAQEQILIHNKYKELYEGEVFTIDEVEEIGMKYRLFLKPASKYMGTIPNDLGTIVSRFAKKHNLSIGTENSNNYDAKRFFILATPQHFNDYASIGDKISILEKDTKQPIKDKWKAMTEIKHDPEMFYKLDNNNLLLLKAWGNDFTFLRQILGFFTRTSVWINLLFLMLIPTIVISALKLIPKWWNLVPDSMVKCAKEDNWEVFSGNGHFYKINNWLWLIPLYTGEIVIIGLAIISIIFLSNCLKSPNNIKYYHTRHFGSKYHWDKVREYFRN